MVIYRFAAQRQFIFSVAVEGRIHLIRFGERNQFGTSVFNTKDEKIAAAIRNNDLFKRGSIAEAPKEVIETTIKAKGKTAQKPTKTPQAKQADEELDIKKLTKPGAAKKPAEDDHTKTFKNITQAKEYLSKTFGIPKTKLKTPALVEQAAKDNGITIVYKTD